MEKLAERHKIKGEENPFHPLVQRGVGAEGCPEAEVQPRCPGGSRSGSGAARAACRPSAMPACHLEPLCPGSRHPAEDPALQNCSLKE